jgi:dihydrofolate reductase
VALIVALDRARSIGFEGRLPWHLPADLAWFKQHTLGLPVVMGRRTFESIGRPLPARRNLVLSRQPDYAPVGTEVHGLLDEALAAARAGDPARVMVIGGAGVFAEALPLASRLYLTRVQATYPADTRFPALAAGQWRCTSARHRPADARNAAAMDFEIWERIGPALTP